MRQGLQRACIALLIVGLAVPSALGQVSPDLVDQLLQSSAQPAPTFSLVANLVAPLFLAVVFTIVGLVLFAAALWLIVKVAPFSVRKEIEEDQNIALGIIVGSIILGISIILAAAMIG